MKKIVISALIMLLLVSSAFKVEATKFPPIVSKNWNGYTFNFYPNGYFTYADFVAKIDVEISDLVNLWTYPLLKPDHILANTKDYVSFIYLHDYATIILWFKNQPELHRFKWGLKISCNELLLMKISLYLAYFNQVTLKQTRIIGENSYFDYYDIKSYKMNITHSTIHKIIKFDIEFGWFEQLDIDPIFGVESGELPPINIVNYGTSNITPTDDSYVSASNPDTNYGAETSLITEVITDTKRSFLKFDLSSLPDNLQIDYAYLNLFVVSLLYPQQGYSDVEVREVSNDNWYENTITWNNQPNYGEILDTKFENKTEKYSSYNVSSFVTTEYTTDKTVSLCLKIILESQSHYRIVSFNSKEGDNTPFLQLKYHKISQANLTYYSKINQNTIIKLEYTLTENGFQNTTFYINRNYAFLNCSSPIGFFTPENATFTRTNYNSTHDMIKVDYAIGTWTWYFKSPLPLIESFSITPYYSNINVKVNIKVYERCNLTLNLYNYTNQAYVKTIGTYNDVTEWLNITFAPEFDGHFYLEVRAKTTYTAWIEALDFYYDTKPPEISLLSPPENSFIAENDIISLEITDSLSGILSTSYKWENGEWQSFTVNYNITVPNFGIEQPKTLYVKATDKCGNTITESYTFKIDNLPPVITMTTKPYRKNYDTVTFQITDYAGVKNATYYIYSWEEFSLIEDNSYSFTVYDLPDGNRTIKVKAYDNLGHEIIKDFWIIVDNEKPTIIRILPVEDVVTEGTAIDFDISDFTSGIDYVRWRINNGEWQILPYPYSILNITAYNLINGTNRIDLEAYDLAGNKETYTFTFLYGVESPTMKQIVQTFLSNMLDFFINPVVMMTITFVLTIMITMIIWYKFIAPRMLQGEFAKKHPTLMGTITMGMTLLAFSFTFILAFLIFSR
ncbi:DNRLRE domain-containing protein [Candidatus Bathyarchaeota archaeon]|nr:DNRLRE domain-containing protein [Candidatus Bathyarchaeota archaeon]